jgi:hypothetical protein
MNECSQRFIHFGWRVPQSCTIMDNRLPHALVIHEGGSWTLPEIHNLWMSLDEYSYPFAACPPGMHANATALRVLSSSVSALVLSPSRSLSRLSLSPGAVFSDFSCHNRALFLAFRTHRILIIIYLFIYLFFREFISLELRFRR